MAMLCLKWEELLNPPCNQHTVKKKHLFHGAQATLPLVIISIPRNNMELTTN